MGLCNEERFEGIVRVINELTGLSDQVRRTLPYSKMAELLDELWPALLSRSGLPSFWLIGSAVNNEYIDGKNLWGVALQEHVEPEERPTRFDDEVLQYLDTAIPTIDQIADGGPSGAQTSLVIQIYGGVEAGFYYLNRYADSFAKELRPLANLFARIHGECYNRMSCSAAFLEAHYRNQLVRKILPLTSDFVSRWWRRYNLHHDVRNGRGIPVEELGVLWAEVQGKSKLPVEKRVLITLTLMGRSYHYEYQHRELLKTIKEHNKKAAKADRINITKVEKALARCRELWAEEEERNRRNYDGRYCAVTSNIRQRQKDEAYEAEHFGKTKKSKKARKTKKAKKSERKT